MRVYNGKISSFAMIAAFAALNMSVAMAQDPDGSRAGTQAAARTAVGTFCGGLINSLVRTENAATQTSNTAFTSFVSTAVTVPSGATRCIKVVFTGEAACAGTTGTDFCYIRALDNGVEMNPQGGGFQTFVSEDSSANAHAYEWVSRVGAGTHIITMQKRSGSTGTQFFLDDWTFDVTVHF